MDGRRLRARIAVLVGSLLFATAVALSVVPVANASPPAGRLRLGHLAPSVGAVEARIEGPDGAASSPRLAAPDVRYGTVSGYVDLAAGQYTVSMHAVGSGPDSPALISAPVRVDAGASRSLFFLDSAPEGRPKGRVVDDDVAAPGAGLGRVRLVQAAHAGSLLEAQAVGGPRLATDLGYGTVTGYATVDARTWDVRLASGGRTEDATLPVGPGSVSTVVVTSAADGALTVQPLVDRPGVTAATGGSAATPVIPRGGVPAGAGGASDGPGVLPLLLALPAAPVLAYGMTVLGAARRRR